MFLARRERHDITRPNLLNRTTFALGPTETGGHNEGLSDRMRVPGGSRTRLKRHQPTRDARRIGRAEQWIDPHRSRKQSAGPLPDGCAPLRLISISLLLVVPLFPASARPEVSLPATQIGLPVAFVAVAERELHSGGYSASAFCGWRQAKLSAAAKKHRVLGG
jgi:hypothetical protein